MSPAHNSSISEQKISIVKAQLEYVAGMADCHIAAFGGHFMTEMGFRWLCSLYRFFINHPGGVCFVAVDPAGKVVGFAAGGQPDIREQFLRFAMRRYPHILFWKFMTRSLVRKVLLDELFKKLPLRCTAVSKGNDKELKADGESGSLLSICVLPDLKGAGVADQLIEIFQKTCAAIGYRHLKLSVVSTNSRAIAFYKKHLWIETGVSGESTRFALDIDSNQSGSEQ
jgi:ribosomal protein S18 acetylase RimI-like enzyme